MHGKSSHGNPYMACLKLGQYDFHGQFLGQSSLFPCIAMEKVLFYFDGTNQDRKTYRIPMVVFRHLG